MRTSNVHAHARPDIPERARLSTLAATRGSLTLLDGLVAQVTTLSPRTGAR